MKKQLEYRDLTLLPRRWFPLWKLDGYILSEFLIKYSVLLLVFATLFVLANVYYEISDFLEAGASLRDTVSYLLYRLPGNIRFVLPISMLLGCMWTMAGFGKNLEITAMRASGVSLFRCSGSIFLVGLIVTGINIYFNEALVPFTEKEAERILTEKTSKDLYVEHYLVYNTNDRARRWLFKTFITRNVQDNVTLKTSWTVPMAERLLKERKSPQFSAMIRKMFPQEAEVILALPMPQLRQRVLRELVGRKVDFRIDRAVYAPKQKSWTFEKGFFVSFDRGDDSTRYQASRGTYAVHEPYHIENWSFPKQEIPETPFDIANAVKEKDDLPTLLIWRILRNTPDLPVRVKVIYETVFWYRLAFPWACFLAVFLGIPLATKNERTGSLMAIISAVGIIIIYIVIAQIFLVLGKGGNLNPVFAGLAPTLGFIGAGIYRLIADKN